MTLEVDVRVRRGSFVVEAAFTVGPSETLALVGPNGSGKSTLVAAIAGLEPPDRGLIALEGVRFDDAQAAIHVMPQERSIGVAFQDRLLFPHLSAAGNVEFPLRARGIGREEASRRARAMLERFGIGRLASARPSALSGGEAQRVALARAMVAEPRILLLDEPLSALDVQARGEIRDLVARTLSNFGGIRVLVTHDPVDALTMADRLVVLEEGRVTQQGTPADIRAAPRTRYAAELVGVNLFVGRLEPLGDGAGRLVMDVGEVVVAWPSGSTGVLGHAIAVLRPVDVALHIEEPHGGSARNVLGGTVESIAVDGERARIRIGSRPPVVAEVTMGSVARLGLREGSRVWASFKAVEARVIVD